LPERSRLTPESAPTAGLPQAGSDILSDAPGDELEGLDRGRERALLYVTLFAHLVGGSVLLRQNFGWATGSTVHTILESIATVLAFIIGGLALVRYYSREQITFLLIGCGFLGAGLLDLNHALTTSDYIMSARVELDPNLRPADLFAWTWTAERMFLSLFLFGSLLAWRQEVREGGAEALPEAWVYGTALVMALRRTLERRDGHVSCRRCPWAEPGWDADHEPEPIGSTSPPPGPGH